MTEIHTTHLALEHGWSAAAAVGMEVVVGAAAVKGEVEQWWLKGQGLQEELEAMEESKTVAETKTSLKEGPPKPHPLMDLSAASLQHWLLSGGQAWREVPGEHWVADAAHDLVHQVSLTVAQL